MMLASCTNEEVLNVSDSRAIGFNGTGIDNTLRKLTLRQKDLTCSMCMVAILMRTCLVA